MDSKGTFLYYEGCVVVTWGRGFHLGKAWYLQDTFAQLERSGSRAS